MEVFHTRIEADGRIQLPRQVLEQLDFEAGQDLDLEIEKKALRISLTKADQRKQAQNFVKSRIGTNRSAVDEFIEERRQEAMND
jgi:bifunctional DNA-binding transcriptional regulator/antitoxin component of YhaV-PrlF toxin-antitoxin module